MLARRKRVAQPSGWPAESVRLAPHTLQNSLRHMPRHRPRAAAPWGAHLHSGCPLKPASAMGPSTSPPRMCLSSSPLVYSCCSLMNTCSRAGKGKGARRTGCIRGRRRQRQGRHATACARTSTHRCLQRPTARSSCQAIRSDRRPHLAPLQADVAELQLVLLLQVALQGLEGAKGLVRRVCRAGDRERGEALLCGQGGCMQRTPIHTSTAMPREGSCVPWYRHSNAAGLSAGWMTSTSGVPAPAFRPTPTRALRSRLSPIAAGGSSLVTLAGVHVLPQAARQAGFPV